MAFKPPEGLPKISGITSALSTPEVQFEKMVKEATKIELPAGPLSMLTKLQESFEAGKAPELPEMPKVEGVLGKLPVLPPLPGIGDLGGGGGQGGSPKGEVAGEVEGGDITLRIKKGIHGEAI